MRVRVRPSKAISLISVVAGLAMVVFGVAWIIPKFGAFGMVWTLVAIVITGYHLFNIVSTRGIAAQEIDVENLDSGPVEESGGTARLQRLKNLRASNLITEEEYQRKKAEIIEHL